MFFTAHFAILAGALVQQAPLSDDSQPVRVQNQHCGRYAIAVLADYIGMPGIESRWDELLPQAQSPFSLAELDKAGRNYGLSTIMLRWDNPAQANIDCPCILYIKSDTDASEPDHFVACFGTRGEEVLLAEYPSLPTWVPKHQLLRHWTGVALYVGKPGDRNLELVESQAHSISDIRPYLLFGATAALILIALTLIAKRRQARG